MKGEKRAGAGRLEGKKKKGRGKKEIRKNSERYRQRTGERLGCHC